MSSTTNKYIAAAAHAAGITQEELLKRIRGLLARSRCRDTERKPIFSKGVIKAIFSA
jgi:hypothetical protein